jgi:hypothetical protein
LYAGLGLNRFFFFFSGCFSSTTQNRYKKVRFTQIQRGTVYRIYFLYF